MLKHGNPPEASGAHNPCLVHASLAWGYSLQTTPHITPLPNLNQGLATCHWGLKCLRDFFFAGGARCWGFGMQTLHTHSIR